MPLTLDGLPFDVLFQIASTLHLDDIIHLGRSCRILQAQLGERTLCRRTVEDQFSHSEEARLARLGKITYKQALDAIYERRHAFSGASPFSARIIGRGNTFLYRQGTLCILNGDSVRVLDAHAPFDVVDFDLAAIVQPVLESTFGTPGLFRTSMLYYSDGILAVHVVGESETGIDHIFAVSTAAHISTGGRVLRAFRLASSSKLFVRHNSRYLYFGTHTGIGDDGHHKWEIDGVSLDKRFPLTKRERPILLENFHGTDIGSTVTFEIQNEFFIAVSNQGTFEVEEIDYTSFYHWIRFPLNDPSNDAVEKCERLYRRQHRSGPIHDSWTDLSLQVDERTQETIIVESRREWAQASSRQSRTFYVTKLDLEPETAQSPTSPMSDFSDDQVLPQHPLSRLVDSSNSPNYMLTPPQWSWSQHPEFSEDDVSPRSFILARTKFRAYNYSCSSFLDLVEDERCCNDPSKPPCLRLRIGSRRIAPEDFIEPSTKGKQQQRTTEPTTPFIDSNVHYRHSQIRMWPPSASRCPCSKRLHDILNAPLPSGPSYTRSITGTLDERTLVYMIKPGRSYGASQDETLGAIVLVNFSRSLHAPPASTPMARADSIMDDEFQPSAWEWAPKLHRECHEGTCR